MFTWAKNPNDFLSDHNRTWKLLNSKKLDSKNLFLTIISLFFSLKKYERSVTLKYIHYNLGQSQKKKWPNIFGVGQLSYKGGQEKVPHLICCYCLMLAWPTLWLFLYLQPMYAILRQFYRLLHQGWGDGGSLWMRKTRNVSKVQFRIFSLCIFLRLLRA